MALPVKLDMGWESIAVNRRRTSSPVNTYGGWWRTRTWVAAARGEGVPAGRLCVPGELAKRQLVAPDGGGPQVTAVEEPVDRFPGDGPVRVALSPAIAGELAQHPLRDLEPVPAGVARGGQLVDHILQRRLRHRAHPLPPGPGRLRRPARSIAAVRRRSAVSRHGSCRLWPARPL